MTAQASPFETRLRDLGDERGLEALYRAAFPQEDLWDLVRALGRDPSQPLNLVAVAAQGGCVIGHITFTRCRIHAPGGAAHAAAAAALLGPLAVAPAEQRRGVGSALVREGLARLAADGFGQVFVLGDPAYYARFGFETETGVAPPHPIPAAWREAWRSLRLVSDAAPATGRLHVPPLWDVPALWSA